MNRTARLFCLLLLACTILGAMSTVEARGKRRRPKFFDVYVPSSCCCGSSLGQSASHSAGQRFDIAIDQSVTPNPNVYTCCGPKKPIVTEPHIDTGTDSSTEGTTKATPSNGELK